MPHYRPNTRPLAGGSAAPSPEPRSATPGNTPRLRRHYHAISATPLLPVLRYAIVFTLRYDYTYADTASCYRDVAAGCH